MTDIHSHVIWRMDDGAKRHAETVELCRIAEQSGTNTLFLTPHLMYWEEAEFLYDQREARVAELENILDEEGINLRLVKGFEILCDDDIFNIKYFKPYTLAGSRYILIEFSFDNTTEEDVTAWCKYLLSCDLVPIIAHPERYEFVLSDISAVERLSQEGVLFQLNAGSPAGMFGEEVAMTALRMLNAGYADFIGSDAHNVHLRNTDMQYCFDRYPRYADMRMAEKAVNENPDYILKDKKYVPFRKNFP